MRTSVALLLLGLLACRDDWAVGPGEGELELRVISTSARGTGPLPAPQVSSAEGQVLVRGSLEAPTPCQDLRARLDRRPGTLFITVTTRGRDVLCAQVAASIIYELVIADLSPGTYQVQLTHAHRAADGTASARALEGLTIAVR
jgi:hypothetical protein